MVSFPTPAAQEVLRAHEQLGKAVRGAGDKPTLPRSPPCREAHPARRPEGHRRARRRRGRYLSISALRASLIFLSNMSKVAAS